MSRRKKLISICVILLACVLAWGFVRAEAWEVDLSLSAQLGYDHGRWERSPDGNHHDNSISRMVEGRILWTRWKWQPTLSISYAWEDFDFSTAQAPIQEANVEILSAHIGITRAWEHLSLFGLVGIDRVEFNPELVEIISENGPCLLPHKGTPSDDYYSVVVGVSYVWGVWKNRIQVGPTASVKVYLEQPMFERCRTFKMGQIQPFLGLCIQF